jgi:arylsulfatase A-like enzyme
MVHALDQNIGRLSTTLDEEGLSENTLVIFTSDNGGLTTITNPDWTAPTSVKPLRAGKGWCYEGGIRVPLLIRNPETKASRSDVPVTSMDLLPTILNLAGIRYEGETDGEDLSPLLEGKELDREAIFWHYPHYHSSGWTPGAAVRYGKWKLIEFYDLEKVELYDLENDLGEIHDLSEIHPEIVNELQDRLRQFQEETDAQLPIFNKPVN